MDCSSCFEMILPTAKVLSVARDNRVQTKLILVKSLNHWEYLISAATMAGLLIICQLQEVQLLASAVNQDMETLACRRRLGDRQSWSFSSMGHERSVLEAP
jgi:hypothetical protein